MKFEDFLPGVCADCATDPHSYIQIAIPITRKTELMMPLLKSRQRQTRSSIQRSALLTTDLAQIQRTGNTASRLEIMFGRACRIADSSILVP